MKKIDRLRWIERTFGPEFVLPWRECHSWDEIVCAIADLQQLGDQVCMRTDLPDGAEQGLALPFVYGADLHKVHAVWAAYQERLVYIIHVGLLPEVNRCNVLVERLGPTQFKVEWDDGGCAQRAWEHACMPLYHAWVEALDDSDECVRYNDLPVPAWSRALGWHVRSEPLDQPTKHRGWTRFVRPRSLPSRTAFERMVDRLIVLPGDADPQTVYTVTDAGRIVVW